LLLGYLSLLFYPHTGFIVNIGGEYDHEEWIRVGLEGSHCDLFDVGLLSQNSSGGIYEKNKISK
jgi:hypothetical protein